LASGLETRFFRRSRARTVWLSAAVSGFLCVANSTLAKAADWYRYENANFIAYSDAAEDKARELLEDLESFRSAFVQVSNITIPAVAPKTRVVITRSGNDFTKYSGAHFIAGFAEHTEDGTILVLPATGYMDGPKTVIRHEYGHALLEFKDFEYPWWYEEGFAELVSSLEFSEDRESFTIGGVIDRARYGTRPETDWDALVSEGISAPEISGEDLSSAYLQAWLLAHYATLGKQLENARKLQVYLDGLNRGESSLDAFANAFGTSPDELWDSELEDYARHMPAYTVRFVSGDLDFDFARARADEAEYRPLIDYLLQRAEALRHDRSPRKPLKYLPGQWAQLSPTSDCADLKRIDVDEEAGTILIDPFMHNPDDELEPRTLSYEAGTKRSLMLTVIDGDEPGEASALWRLQLRNKKVLCMSRPDWGEPLCKMMLKKCSP